MLDAWPIFLDVHRTGSFAAAARERGCAPSSVSRTIAALEEHLGTRLFHRTTRVLRPTTDGERLAVRVKPLVEGFTAIEQEARDPSVGLSGTLRLTASVAYAQRVVIPVVRAFRVAHPGVRVDLVASDASLDLVGERIDVALRHGELADRSWVASKVHAVSYGLYASAEYLSGRNRLDSPGKLYGHDLLTFSYEGFRVEWTLSSGGKRETIQVDPVMTSSNGLLLHDAAVASMGIAMLADWTVAEAVHDGRLVRVLPEWALDLPGPPRAIWAVRPSRAHTPRRVSAFLEVLRTHA